MFGYNMKLPYMEVTYKFLQQNDWSLPLVPNYTNSFDIGLFPLISRRNTNLFQPPRWARVQLAYKTGWHICIHSAPDFVTVHPTVSEMTDSKDYNNNETDQI